MAEKTLCRSLERCGQIDFSSIDELAAYIHKFGVNGPIIIIIMFFIQSMVPLIPYAILAGAAGVIYGKLIGFIMAWSAAMAGTFSIFLLAKYAGRGFLSPLIDKRYQLDFENISPRKVFLLLLIVRVFPVIPTPVINIGSGLSGVSMGIFASSSAVGMMPWAAAYVVLGDYFNRSRNLSSTLAILGAILIIIITGVFYLRKYIHINRVS